MGDGFPFLDIIFFAMVAAFLILRLRSVLGKRTGNERPRQDPFQPRPEQDEDDSDNVVSLPKRDGARPDMTAAPGSLAASLTQVKIADPSFDEKYFASGAQAAFEMIVAAFARGDKDALRPLLDDDVYDRFAAAIDQRVARGETLETTLVEIKAADITEAAMKGSQSHITVEFVTEQINVTRDAEGKPVEGDPEDGETIVDIWTFARDTRSDDPNWLLVATRTPT